MSRAAKTDGEKAGGELRSLDYSAAWWNVSKFLMKAFSRLWFRLRIEGSQRVPAAGPVLLVANHTSYLDPPMVGVSVRRRVAFLAQKGLAKLWPMRLWLRKVGVTLIDRDAPSTAALRLVADLLKAGQVVGIFPEGTRSGDGRVAPFRSGVEFLVRRTGAMVVPIGIDGAHRAFPRGARFVWPRRVVVRIGEAVTAEQVLAPGGVEALRRRVAELAHAELRAPEAESQPPAEHARHSMTGAAAVDPRTSPSSPSSAGGGA